jgi:hypothetical protein
MAKKARGTIEEPKPLRVLLISTSPTVHYALSVSRRTFCGKPIMAKAMWNVSAYYTTFKNDCKNCMKTNDGQKYGLGQ